MTRENANVYDVLESDKVVFTGSALEISERYGVKYSNVYTYVKRGIRLNRKYKVVFSHTMHYLIEATDKTTKEKFVGTAEDIGEIFYYSPLYVLDAVHNGRNLATAKLRLIEDVNYDKTYTTRN